MFPALGNARRPPLLPLQGWKGHLGSKGAQGAGAAVLHHAGYSTAGGGGAKLAASQASKSQPGNCNTMYGQE